MRHLQFLFLLGFCTTFFVSYAHAQEEKQLLADAIRATKSITAETPIKDKLSAYENALKNVDEIINKHGATDTGLKLLSDQTVGTFDPKTVRVEYMKILFEYYDTVCETSPSYSCLGFTSLKVGTATCKSAKKFKPLFAAHHSLINAVRIFKGQKTDVRYINLALTSYRTCRKKVSGVRDQWAKGYFTLPLINVLLELGEKKKAIGIIQQLKSPFHKTLSVLSLKANSGKKADQSYLNRITKYIDKKVPVSGAVTCTPQDPSCSYKQRKRGYRTDRNGPYFNAVAKLELLKFALANGDPGVLNKYKRKRGGWVVGMMNIGSMRGKLTPFMADYLFEVIFDISNRMKPLLTANDYKNFVSQFSQGIIAMVLTKNHRSILTLYERIGREKGDKIASEYLKRAKSKRYTDREMYVFVSNIFIPNKEAYYKTYKEGKFPDNFVKRTSYPFEDFKKAIDFENVCGGSELLFKRLKKTKNYQDAIAYFVNSPKIDPSKIYKCGDSDLELLLK